MERLNPLAERDGSFDRRASSLLSNPGPSRSSRSWLTRMTFAVLLLAAAFPFGAHGSCDFQFPPDEPQSTLPSHYSRFKVFDCRHTSTFVVRSVAFNMFSGSATAILADESQLENPSPSFFNVLGVDPSDENPCLNKLTIDAALEGDKYASGAVGFHPALSIKCASADDCVDTIIRFQGYCGDYVVPSAKGPTPSYPALWPTTGECAGSSPHNNCLLSSDCSQLRCTAIVEGTPIAINMGVCDDSVLFTITETSETHSETGSGDAAGFSLSALGSGSSRSYVVSTLPNIYKGMLTDRTFRVRLVDSGPQDGTSDYRVLVNLDSCEGTSDSDPCEKLLELVDVTMHRRSPPYCSVPAAIYPAKPPAPPALCAHVPHLPANCHVEADCTVITCNVLVESVPLTISLQPCSGNKVYAKTAGWEQTLLEGSAAVLRTDLSIPTDGLLRNRVLVLRVTNSHWKSGGMFLEVNLDRCFQYSLDECEKLIGLISVTLPSAYGPQACSSSASSSNSGGSVFVIAGAVAGTLVLIATVVAVVIWRRRHHDEATYEDMAELQGDFVAQNEG